MKTVIKIFKNTNIQPAYTTFYTIQNGIMEKHKCRHIQTQQNVQTAKHFNNRYKMRVYVFIAILMKFQVFWDVTPC
jgi:hypothetical protein